MDPFLKPKDAFADAALNDVSHLKGLFPTAEDEARLKSCVIAVRTAIQENQEAAARWEALASAKETVISVLSTVLKVPI